MLREARKTFKFYISKFQIKKDKPLAYPFLFEISTSLFKQSKTCRSLHFAIENY